VLVEIVRPGTGDPVPEGEVGELVVTTLNPDYPLVRFGTGDLSAVLPGISPCGRTNTRIKGWLGRADQTTKVKGMFVHPKQVAEVGLRHPELLRLRLVVGRAAEQDTMTLLAECGSHAVVGAALGSYRTSERTLAREMVDRLDKSMLLLADRGFVGHDIWRTFAQSGVQMLWRVGSNIKLEAIKTLRDGTTLAQLDAPKELAKTGALPITVRVIEYELEGVAKPETEGTRYRLITTLLDPRKAPAIELASLYQERWEIEILLDELKTHLRGRAALLRSKTPDLVRQEAYGLLLVHHAVRRIMLDAAQSIGDDPDRISFTATVRIIRRKLLQGSFSPLDDQGRAEEEL